MSEHTPPCHIVHIAPGLVSSELDRRSEAFGYCGYVAEAHWLVTLSYHQCPQTSNYLPSVSVYTILAVFRPNALNDPPLYPTINIPNPLHLLSTFQASYIIPAKQRLNQGEFDQLKMVGLSS